MKNRFFALLLAVSLLAGCASASQAPTVPDTGPPSTTAPTETVPTETVPESTVPPEETQPPEVTQPEAPLPEAQRIEEGFQILRNSEIRVPQLVDGNFNTKLYLTDKDTLSLESRQPVYSLYLVWDAAPGAYSICWDGGQVDCGTNGFLHEYVALPQGVTQAAFVFRDSENRILCDVLAYGEGSAPSQVQVWQPPCEEADILVFPTHADDDTIFFGALMAYYTVERQLKVQTAFMVDHVGYPERSHERLNGLWSMGIRHYPVVGHAPDLFSYDFPSALNYYAPSDILGWQVEQLRRFRPLVVVGHDLEGEYGNAGHIVNTYHLVQAITAAADPETDPDSVALYGTWQPAKLYLHLYPENELYLDVNTPMVNDPQGRTPFEAAKDGLAAHASQFEWGVSVQQGEYNRVYDCRPFGLYFTLVGTDSHGDLMENVSRDTWNGSE